MSQGIVLPTHPLFKDLTGKPYGRLTVVSYAGRSGKRQVSSWTCDCECGRQVVVLATSLQTGTTTSCGCLYVDTRKTANKTHGLSKSRTYRVWSKMIARCNDPSDISFGNYGGRGISVCERWRDFANFYADMGQCPAGCEIDRYPNNDGNYEPGNCRWATRTENARNKRNNHLLTFNGQTQCISEWAEQTGLPRYTILKRLESGWSVDEALTTPKRSWSKSNV